MIWGRVRGCAAGLLAAGLLADGAVAGDLDDVLGGFESEDSFGADEADERAAPAEPRCWDFTGSVELGSSINYLEHESSSGTDYTGLSRLRSRLNLQLDVDLPRDWKLRVAGYGFYDFAYLIDRDEFTEEVLDSYEWEVDFQDVWIQGSVLEDLDLKLGRQVVNWGRSDTIRVLDVLNPLDNREPGLVDIEDLRRPVAMARADYYFGNWSLTGIAIPEVRVEDYPRYGSDFFPDLPIDVPPELSGLVPSVQSIPHLVPRESPGNSGYAFALAGIFEGWDLSFHFARFWRDRFHLDPNVISFEPPDFRPSFRHSRVTLVGAGGNYTIGSWLFKAEIAYLDGLDYTVTEPLDPAWVIPDPAPECTDLFPVCPDIPTDTVERSRTDAMVGIEYYGFTDTTIAVEVVNRHIHDFQSNMRTFYAQRNSLETAIRYTADFFHSRLHVIGLAVIFGEKAQDGSVIRLSADYDLRDALVVGGGILLFNDGDLSPFDTIYRNDRVFLHIKYSF